MAESFMIRFAFNGKHCYANVYIQNSDSGKFHLHLVNPNLCPGLPSELIFTSVDGKLIYDGPHEVPGYTLDEMMQAIEKSGKWPVGNGQ